MKNKFTLAFILAGFLWTSLATAQVIPTQNVTTEVYKKLNYVASSATDTTVYRQFAPADNIVILGSATDSAYVIVSYMLKESVTGLETAFVLADTLQLAGSGGDQLIANLPIATVGGYDQIKFEINYITATTLVTGATVRFYIRLLN